MHIDSEKIRGGLRISGSLLGAGFLGYQIINAVRNINESTLSHNYINAFIFGLILSIAANLLQMIAWKVLLAGLGFNLSLAAVLINFPLSFVARYIPGTIWGYLTRSEWLKRDHQIPFAISNLGSLIEVVGIVLSTLIIMLVGAVGAQYPFYILLLVFLLFVGSWAAMNLAFSLNKFHRVFNLQTGHFRSFPFMKWAILIALYTAMWFSYGLGLALFGNVVNVSISYSQAVSVSAIYAFAWLIGFIVPFLPSGLGLREYLLSFLLAAWYGLLQPQAAIISVGFRFIVSLAELSWVFIGSLKKVNYWFARVQIKK